MNVLFLTSDLLFSSRVCDIGTRSGVTVQVCPDLASLQGRLSPSPPAAVFIDLEDRQAIPADVLACLAATEPRCPSVAYGPHVHAQLLQAAVDAGFDRVLTRGQFHAQVAQLFQQLTQSQGPAP